MELSGDVQDFAGWRNPSPCVAREWDALQPAEAFTAETAWVSDFGKPFSRYAARLGLPHRERENSGPRCGIRKVSEAASSVEQITQFAEAGVKLRLLRNCDASFKAPSPPSDGGGRFSMTRYFRNGRDVHDLYSSFGKGLPPSGAENSLGA